MDTLTVEEQIQLIKSHMPETYQSIKARAAAHGNGVYAEVRQGLAGKPNVFYAMEAGHVMGTPFNDIDVTNKVAGLMVKFGCKHLVMWARPCLAPPV